MSTATATPPGTPVRRVAVDSLVGSVWTLLSRVSGLLRFVVIAAVLGPTQFADLYQAANNLPNMVFELLVGALLTSLLVPALVRHFDAGDPASAARLTSGFLTLSVGAAALLVAIAAAAGPWVVDLLTASVPANVARTPTGPATVLVSLLLLQVPLYLWIGTAAAAQNARGSFGLPAGAPTTENLGIIAVLATYAAVFGKGTPDGHTWGAVLLLGGGTTGAVLLHALVQSWGAHRCGAGLRLQRSLRPDPEVRALIRLTVPSLGLTVADFARYLCIIVVAAAVPGGVVALELAWSFYQLPVALAARPVAQASLPGLSRAHHRGDDQDYGRTFGQGLRLALFVAVPATVAYGLLSHPLILALTYGEMATPHGRALLEACLRGISLGVIGQAAFVFATQAAYARRDAGRPLRGVMLRTATTVAGSLLALALVHGPGLLLAIGLSIAAGDLVGAAYLCWSIYHPLPRSGVSLIAVATRTGIAGGAMGCVVLVLSALVGTPTQRLPAIGMIAAVGAAGLVTYLAAQWLLRSPEVTGLVALVGGRRKSGGAEGD